MRTGRKILPAVQITKRNIIELAVMTILFCIAAVLVYKTTIAIRVTLPRIETVVSGETSDAYLLKDGDHLEQTFIYERDDLLSAGVTILLRDEVMSDYRTQGLDGQLGSITITVSDASDGVVLMEESYEVGTLANEQNLLASYTSPAPGFQGRNLKITIDAEGFPENLGMSILADGEIANATSLTINGQEQLSTLSIKISDHQFLYWKKWGAVGALLLYVLMAGTYLGLAVFRCRPQTMFLFTGSILALLYLLLIPPIAVPDEEAHIKEVYYYSNILMGKNNSSTDQVTMDKEDYNALNKFQTTPSLSEYDILKEDILKSGRQEGTKDVPRLDTQAPVITYIPGILGVTLARLLGLNGILVFLMGRLCAILFYLFTMYWFIRLMPFGKAAAFIIAILPMTIQQCTSYSYDSFVIEIAFLYLALLLTLIYKGKAIRIPQILLYAFFMVILAITKGGTYMPLALLTMLIPASCIPALRKNAPAASTRRKWGFVGLMAMISIISFIIGTLGYVLYVAAPTAEQAAGAYLQGESYGAAGLLASPFTYISLSVRTIFLEGDTFLEGMLGMQLGWLNLDVTRLVIYSLFILMILAVLITESDKENTAVLVKISHKIFYIFVIFCSMTMVFTSMFMSWTPKLSTTIAGIQGRYFLPLLPIFLLLFRNKNVVVKRDMTARLLFIATALQCVVIYCILLSVERVL
ncbi:MAG: DUF2142 domain-containing protein [Lachnospiraceae bacterium]